MIPIIEVKIAGELEGRGGLGIPPVATLLVFGSELDWHAWSSGAQVPVRQNDRCGVTRFSIGNGL
jgi:hypothetical protein